MAAGFLSMAHPAITLSGIAGNVISFLVFLAPLTTFVQVVRKKTTGGFSAVPYVVALFSSTLWILYALLKGNSRPLLTINGFGCGVELVYVVAYLLYAPRRARLRALAYFLALDVAAFAVVAAVALLGVAPEHRVKFLGSVCLAFSMAVFVAPLSIIFKVIKTKSVEFMPISLSFCLVLSAVAWFCYGYFTKDPYVMYPNVGGFFFSCVQMGLYFYYRRPSNAAVLPTTADGATGGAAVQAQVIELPPHAVAILSVSNIPILGVHKIEVMAAPAPPPEQQDIEKPAPAPEAVETGAATTAAV